MAKTKEELEALQKQYKELSEKCRELTDEELAQVTGGGVLTHELLTHEPPTRDPATLDPLRVGITI